MNEIKKHSLALSLIALLCCIKFVIIPILEWQDDKIFQLNLLEKKLNKVTALSEKEQKIKDVHQDLIKANTDLTKAFYSFKDEELFKREQQKKIEEQLKAYDLKINNIGWNTSMAEGDLFTQLSVNYNFSGAGEKAIKYLLSIATEEKYSEIESLNTSFIRQYAGALGQFKVNLRRNYFMDKANATLNETEKSK